MFLTLFSLRQEYIRLSAEKNTRGIKGIKEVKELRDLKDFKDLRDFRDLRDLNDFKDLKDFRDFRDLRDFKDLREQVAEPTNLAIIVGSLEMKMAGPRPGGRRPAVMI